MLVHGENIYYQKQASCNIGIFIHLFGQDRED